MSTREGARRAWSGSRRGRSGSSTRRSPSHVGVDAAFGAGPAACLPRPRRSARRARPPGWRGWRAPRAPPAASAARRHAPGRPARPSPARELPLAAAPPPAAPSAPRNVRRAAEHAKRYTAQLRWHSYGDYRTQRRASRKYLDRVEPTRLSLMQRSCARLAMSASRARSPLAGILPASWTGVGASPPGAHAASSRPPWHPPSLRAMGAASAGRRRVAPEPFRYTAHAVEC